MLTANSEKVRSNNIRRSQNNGETCYMRYLAETKSSNFMPREDFLKQLLHDEY